MLTLGAFRSAVRSRPCPLKLTSTLRNTHPHLTPFLRSPARPHSWQASLWYRRDGTPRSTREGVIYVALALLIGSQTLFVADLYRELETIFTLMHIRRMNSCYRFDLSQPADIVEYIFKLSQVDFTEDGKKYATAAREGILYTLTVYPEACTYIRSQLEKVRDLTMNDDINQDIVKTARETEEVLAKAIALLFEKADDVQGIQHLKEKSSESEAKDLYREIR